MQNNWKALWGSRTAEMGILRDGDPRKVFLELKRSDGFDVVEGGISYETFLAQYRQMKERLSRGLPPRRNTSECV